LIAHQIACSVTVVEAAANPQERTKLERELKTLEAAAVARERAKEAQVRARRGLELSPPFA